MGSKNKLSDEELRVAASEVLKYELAIFDSYADYPDHSFRGEFRLKMATLLHDAKRGAVKTAEYSMGFVFYAKRCIAAVLLIFMLTCIAMPETVMAGYQKLIEVIETVFEEYTEYRYRVNDVGGIEEKFRPIKLGYLPKGMEETKRIEQKNSIYLLFMDEQDLYLNIYQKKIVENSGLVYTLDSENTIHKFLWVKNEYMQLLFENNEIRFLNLHNDYRIIGKTNLTEKELINILEQIEY